MWSEIKSLYPKLHRIDINPTKVHSNNEVALIKATQSGSPAMRIVTCLFQMKKYQKNK